MILMLDISFASDDPAQLRAKDEVRPVNVLGNGTARLQDALDGYLRAQPFVLLQHATPIFNNILLKL
jgi:hypothetical protein